jgi:hypothetical protein
LTSCSSLEEKEAAVLVGNFLEIFLVFVSSYFFCGFNFYISCNYALPSKGSFHYVVRAVEK